jgi:hypothetical protein
LNWPANSQSYCGRGRDRAGLGGCPSKRFLWGRLAAHGRVEAAGKVYQVLARVFRGKFLAGLRKLYQQGHLSLSGSAEPLDHPVVFEDLLDRLRRKSWWVYSKPPFGGPEQVLQYLARYTHRVALSNHRLRRLDHDQVTFSYKDYTQGGGTREMTLPAEELSAASCYTSSRIVSCAFVTMACLPTGIGSGSWIDAGGCSA